MGYKRKNIKQQLSRGSKFTAKQLASCIGKIRHSSYEIAKKNNTDKLTFVKPYKCKFCPYYHVGRKKKE